MTRVDMRPLKERALKYPEPVKSLILKEPEYIDSKDFIIKMETWENLLKMEMQK